MTCLKIEEIYSHIDGTLPLARQAEIEHHLSSCSRCREAVAKRRLLEQAASALPDLELPPDFSRRVMATILRQHSPVPSWFAGLMIGLSSLGLVCFWIAISGSKAGLTFISSFFRFCLAYFKNATVLLAKIMILLSSAGKTFWLIAGAVAKCLSLLPALFSPQVQATSLVLGMALLISLYFGLKKKLFPGVMT